MKVSKSLTTIEEIVKSYKRFATITIVCSLLSIPLCTYILSRFMAEAATQVYVTRDFRVEKVVDKVSQIKYHSEMFYKLFFEIDQNNFKTRTDNALYLIGESGKMLRNTYAERNWYTQIVQNNARITVDVDTIRVNDKVYPYEVEVSAVMRITRESASSRRYINSHFIVKDVNNSDENPFGLMIENFTVTNNNEILDEN